MCCVIPKGKQTSKHPLFALFHVMDCIRAEHVILLPNVLKLAGILLSVQGEKLLS